MRKLLGYRLKEEFRQDKSIVKASCIIDGYENFGESISDGQVIYNDTSKLKQAGVMHWFEEVYEEENLEVGKWYKKEWNDGDVDIFLALSIDGDRVYFKDNYYRNGKLLDTNGTETCSISTLYNDDRFKFLEATTEEIQQALIKEATKRGFKEGVKVTRSFGCDEICETRFSDLKGFKYDLHFNRIQCFGICIFDNGEWAEILPNETLNGKTAIIDGVEYELKIKN